MRFLVVVRFFKTDSPVIGLGILFTPTRVRAREKPSASERHPREAARLGTTSLHPSADRVDRLLANLGFPVSRLSHQRS